MVSSPASFAQIYKGRLKENGDLLKCKGLLFLRQLQLIYSLSGILVWLFESFLKSNDVVGLVDEWAAGESMP